MEEMGGRPAYGRTLTQLRRHPRVRISAPFPCALGRIGLNRRLVMTQGDLGVVYDVSKKGARLMTEAVISPGDRITISLQLPHHLSPTFIEHATVRWGKQQTYGVEFEGLSPLADTCLEKFVVRASKLAATSAS